MGQIVWSPKYANFGYWRPPSDFFRHLWQNKVLGVFWHVFSPQFLALFDPPQNANVGQWTQFGGIWDKTISLGYAVLTFIGRSFHSLMLLYRKRFATPSFYLWNSISTIIIPRFA